MKTTIDYGSIFWVGGNECNIGLPWDNFSLENYLAVVFFFWLFTSKTKLIFLLNWILICILDNQRTTQWILKQPTDDPYSEGTNKKKGENIRLLGNTRGLYSRPLLHAMEWRKWKMQPMSNLFRKMSKNQIISTLIFAPAVKYISNQLTCY